MVEFAVVGQSTPRIDGREMVTGEAIDTVDIALPGMFVGEILRSPVPHASIQAVDTETARSLRGVMSVVTGADTPKKYGYRPERADEYALAVGKVQFADVRDMPRQCRP